jgi:hypothetical protein
MVNQKQKTKFRQSFFKRDNLMQLKFSSNYNRCANRHMVIRGRLSTRKRQINYIQIVYLQKNKF